MQSLLSELTIVIPTKNRAPWLKRVFQYYSEYNFTGKIIIIDSSNLETFMEINEIKNNYKDLNIDTFHFPDFNVESAINAILGEIQTKYSVFLADDDILLTEGLSKAVNFLNNNDTYVAALGNAYMLGTLTNKPFGPVHALVDYSVRSYDNDDGLKRIEDYLDDPRALCFSVTNSKVFIECYKSMMGLERRYQEMVFGETFQAICYLIRGKIIKLESEYLVRQFHPGNLYHKIDYVAWLKGEGFNKACDFLEKYIKLSFNYERNNQVEKIFKKYLKGIINHKRNIDKQSIVYFLKKNLPIQIIKILKKVKFFLIDSYKVKRFDKTVELNNYIRIIESKKFNRKLK